MHKESERKPLQSPCTYLQRCKECALHVGPCLPPWFVFMASHLWITHLKQCNDHKIYSLNVDHSIFSHWNSDNKQRSATQSNIVDVKWDIQVGVKVVNYLYVRGGTANCFCEPAVLFMHLHVFKAFWSV